MAVVALGHLSYPYVRDLLIALAFPLMLPAIAVLHTRHRSVRDSGAVLATVCGTSVVAVGLAGSVNVDLQPAAMVLLGMWWWTVGKMWAETGAMPRTLGSGTAVLGALAIMAGLYGAVNVGLTVVRPGSPAIAAWPLAEATLGAWLIALALALWRRSSAVPSR